MVAGHERDGRAWKAEWVALPEVCLLTGTALQMARRLVYELVVDDQAMRANLDRYGDRLASEQVLAGLTAKLGKHAAQDLMHRVLAPGSRDVRQVLDALVDEGVVTADEGRTWVSWQVGDSAAMVDEVVHRARLARDTEPEEWA
jgi:adenylosuccinate lyase